MVGAGGAGDAAPLALDGSECVWWSRCRSAGGTAHNISGQTFKLHSFRVSHYERAQPLVFHLMGRLRSLGVKY